MQDSEETRSERSLDGRRPSVCDRRRWMAFQGEDVNVAVPNGFTLEGLCNVFRARVTGRVQSCSCSTASLSAFVDTSTIIPASLRDPGDGIRGE